MTSSTSQSADSSIWLSLVIVISQWGWVSTVLTRGNTVFVLDWLELYIHGNISDLGSKPYPPWVPLASRTPANQSADRVGVFTPCGTVLTRGSPFSPPFLLELLVHGVFSDLGMGPYPPRVRGRSTNGIRAWKTLDWKSRGSDVIYVLTGIIKNP